MNKTIKNLKKLVLAEMCNPNGYLDVVRNVERDLKYNMGIACKNHWSINDWKPEESFSGKDGKAQLTSFISARLFDLWEDAIIEVIETKLKRINMNIKVEHKHSQKGDMIIIFSKKHKEIWEIKSSQTKDAFTGSTHSTGKENQFTNYILINYCINRNKKMTLGKNKGIISEAAVFLGKIKLGRSGKEDSTNSRTSLKIPLREANKLTPVIGRLITHCRRKRWAGIKREKINVI